MIGICSQDYYIKKILAGEYNKDQIIMLKKTAVRQQWSKLERVCNGERPVEDVAVEAAGFLAMLNKLPKSEK